MVGRFLRRDGELERLLRQHTSTGWAARRAGPDVVSWVLSGEPVEVADQLVFIGHPAPELVRALEQAPPAQRYRGLALLAPHTVRMGEVPATERFLAGLSLLKQVPTDREIDEMIAAAGVDESELVTASLMPSARWARGGNSAVDTIRARSSHDDRLLRNPNGVRAALFGDAKQAEGVAAVMVTLSDRALSNIAPFVAELLRDTSKQRRAAGAIIASRVDTTTLLDHLRPGLTSKRAPERAATVRAMVDVAAEAQLPDVIDSIRSTLADETASKVLEAIAGLDTVAAVNEQPPPVVWPELTEQPVARSLKARFVALVHEQHDQAVRLFRHQQEMVAQGRLRGHAPDLPPRPDARDVDRVWAFVAEGKGDPGVVGHGHRPPYWRIVDLVPELPLLAAVRAERVASTRLAPLAMRRLTRPHSVAGRWTLLELHAALEQAGFDRTEVLQAIPGELDWPDEQITEWAAALLPEIELQLRATDFAWGDAPSKYYQAVGALPSVPTSLRRRLFEQGVSGRKETRPHARASVASDPAVVSTVAGFLSGGAVTHRASAAEWLGALDADAVPHLHTAATKEKHDLAKAAILTALERHGEDVTPYISREQLRADAAKGAKKALPKAAEWVPFDSLPALRWRDGEPVAPEVVRWLISQAIRLKDPTPSPIIRRYFEQMVDDDVATFAEALLSLWMAEDLTPIPYDDAIARAKQALKGARAAPQYHPEAWAALSDADLLARLTAQHAQTPAASAIASKGLLSLVAAGAGPTVVAPVEQYVRRWYGMRAAQCKAMMTLLAWVEHPSAIQLLLTIGTRFRTKSIQKTAMDEAEALADRRGWTMEDLAYRTIPTGGFDIDGVLTLEYGERTFTVRLADDLSVVLTNDDGKTIKSLPAARKDEDDDLVKEAKKDFADAKKHVKTAGKQQPLRLHEAMCTQRVFAVDDFRRYVLEHPVMRRLATRLVWIAVHADERRVAFRPLSDGTLLDVTDDDVDLDGAAGVQLAHQTLLDDDAGRAWRSHLVDYEVAPLFEQFGRAEMPALEAGQLRLDDVKGAIIDDRRIRGMATRLGYDLAPAEDAGFVPSLRRRFPSVGLEAHIGTAGLHAMVMENEVALLDITFTPVDAWGEVPLRDVPEILVIEVLADANEIVTAGDGITADWEARIRW